MSDNRVNSPADPLAKRFYHDGTEYRITGDATMAMAHFSEVRSHLHQLKRTNVNDLPIVTGMKYFDDGTVARYSLVHGHEKIDVFSPIFVGGLLPEEEDKPKATLLIKKIIPCIRSIDNEYFVACLSGTFEEPYYVFKNTSPFPPEAFNDNVETEIDKEFLSEGSNLLEDSIDKPKLFFVAQTGVAPEDGDYSYGETTFEDGTRWDDMTCAEHAAYLGGTGAECCFQYGSIAGNLAYTGCVDVYVEPYSYQGSDSTPLSMFGQASAIPSAGVDKSVHYTTYFYRCCESQIYTDCDSAILRAYEVVEEYRQFMSSSELCSLYEYPGLLTGGFTEVYKTVTFSGYITVSSRPEKDNVLNHASCYRVKDQVYSGWNKWNGLSSCDGAGGDSDSEWGPAYYTDFFHVDTMIFELKPREASEYPKYLQHMPNQLKYYNTDSPARITALMSAIIYETGTVINVREYFYVGPNNGNTLSSTKFDLLSSDGPYKHTISDIKDKDGNLVEFAGEIFLGKIEYNIEIP